MSFCESDPSEGPFFFDELLHAGERKPYTFRGKLKANERFVAAHVDIVDDTFTQVVTDSVVTIELQNFGQIAGVKWGAAATVSRGSADAGCCAVVWLRFSVEIDATPPLPVTRKLVQIWGVRIKP